jgi:hypothetical protein
VAAGGEKFAEAWGGFGNDVGCGDADHVEALVLAVGDDESLRRLGILDQKSRSA